ncbi:superoxide dismutase [Fe]-like [Schistocerca gregaria]|uniref:superoxide dismutase [Fe]-like n=1 Tax=Schistocerca gregaria TaxID=7010 RepID=UPI00211EDD1E|nr:superoxide dismutase [Fe]-like [Schistocerca gregaria]
MFQTSAFKNLKPRHATSSPRPAATPNISRPLFVLPKLPYKIDCGLSPLWSPKEINIHYNKLHLGYVIKANHYVEPSRFELLPLDDVVRRSSKKIVDAQINAFCSHLWNHNFMWNTLTPSYRPPSETMMENFRVHFNGFESFKKRFTKYALALHGCGNTWLVDMDGQWEIINTYNSQCALSIPKAVPLLILDLWEHAYYGDYEDRRPEYIENWWKVVNWNYVEEKWKSIDRTVEHVYD